MLSTERTDDDRSRKDGLNRDAMAMGDIMLVSILPRPEIGLLPHYYGNSTADYSILRYCNRRCLDSLES